jgi:hypothetical protein
MTFGIHNTPDPAEAFEAVKAQRAENHGFVWFSVLDHMIRIPRPGTPGEPVLEGWTVPGAACCHQPHPSGNPGHGGRLSQSRASRQDRGERRSGQPGTADARRRRRLFRG